MVGLIPDLTRICGQAWLGEGDLIYLLGRPLEEQDGVTLGCSEYLAVIHATVAGSPPSVNFDLERRVQAACREGIRQGWVRSAHDCAEGGLVIALSEACIAGQLGAEINLGLTSKLKDQSRRWDEVLFGEGGARILVSVSLEQQALWESYLKQQLGNDWQKIGQVRNADTPLQVFTADNQPLINVTIKLMSDHYYNAIPERLAL
jgi:phosphoribosylformylglycinamidine synthase